MKESSVSGRKGLLVLLFFPYALITLWRWKIIAYGILSFILTPFILLTSDSMIARYVNPGIIENWIASLAWLAMGTVYLWYGRRVFRQEISRSDTTSDSSAPALARIDIIPLLLLLFLLVGIAAPIFAPFDPAAQGNLRTSLFLRPLDKGTIAAGAAQGVLAESTSASTRSYVSILDDIDHTLLGSPRKVRTATSDETIFLLGTDHLGRDVLSRLIYGIRLSLLIGLCAMIFSVVLGSVIGFAAGMAGGWADVLLMRVTDLFLAIPSLFLIIACVAFFGNSAFLLIAVLAATGWMGVARLVRAEVISLREREFVQVARLLRRSAHQILRDHMLPNVLPVIAAASVLQLGNVILAEAALSFLGLGIQPPTPSLGNMIGESMAYIDSAWWIGIFPGIALSALVVVVNLFAERLLARSRH